MTKKQAPRAKVEMSMASASTPNMNMQPTISRAKLEMMAEDGPTVSGDTNIDPIEDFQKHPDLKHDEN